MWFTKSHGYNKEHHCNDCEGPSTSHCALTRDLKNLNHRSKSIGIGNTGPAFTCYQIDTGVCSIAYHYCISSSLDSWLESWRWLLWGFGLGFFMVKAGLGSFGVGGGLSWLPAFRLKSCLSCSVWFSWSLFPWCASPASPALCIRSCLCRPCLCCSVLFVPPVHARFLPRLSPVWAYACLLRLSPTTYGKTSNSDSLII